MSWTDSLMTRNRLKREEREAVAFWTGRSKKHPAEDLDALLDKVEAREEKELPEPDRGDKTVGFGTFRPAYGKFEVTGWE